MTPGYWHQASADLALLDPVLATLVGRFAGTALVSRGDPFVTLLRSIVGQQISVQAADSVWARFLAAMPPVVAPAAVLAIEAATLRRCGLSARKVEYVVDLARHFDGGQIHPDRWTTMSDAEITAELTTVRGIGVWTAEMFLIFNQLRPDVFPLDDLGLQFSRGKLAQVGLKGVECVHGELQRQRNISGIIFAQNLAMILSGQDSHPLQQVVRNRRHRHMDRHTPPPLHSIDHRLRRFRVRFDESTSPKQRPAKVTGDNQNHIAESAAT